MASAIFQMIARALPNIKLKLKKAGMNYSPEEFVKRTFLSAFYMTTGLVVSLVLILAKFNVLKGIMAIFVPIIFLLLFSYMLKLPDVTISRKEKSITKEIIFAGRHLIIELESGVPLYNAFINISKNYEAVGHYFKEVINKVDLGTSRRLPKIAVAGAQLNKDRFRGVKVIRIRFGANRKGANNRGKQVRKKIKSAGNVLHDNSGYTPVFRRNNACCIVVIHTV